MLRKHEASTRSRGLEAARTTATTNQGLGVEILHRKIKRIKFNRAVVVSSKTTTMDKIFKMRDN